MGDFQAVMSLLSGAGDVGIYLVAFILWKFDRRLILLETTFSTHVQDDIKAMDRLLNKLDGV